MIARLAAVWLVLLVCAGHSQVLGHALEPAFLELQALDGQQWRVTWRKPSVGGGAPMPIEALLPETCAPRRGPAPQFDGRAFVTGWLAACPEGLARGEILIEGLDATQTDVLVRYELAPGETQAMRLTAGSPAFTVPAAPDFADIVTSYFGLGVEHILQGLDHLLFVFALLLLIRARGRLIAAITAFTIAHSLTLAAAALGWLVVPAPPVEAVVALSIMFLAAELARGPPARERLSERYPWVVAFAFGLLHGLGFARALLELGLPQGDVPLALFAFNLGVEAGQLLFVALVLITGALLARLYPILAGHAARPGGPGVRTAAYAMGGLAAFWVIARVAAF